MFSKKLYEGVIDLRVVGGTKCSRVPIEHTYVVQLLKEEDVYVCTYIGQSGPSMPPFQLQTREQQVSLLWKRSKQNGYCS